MESGCGDMSSSVKLPREINIHLQRILLISCPEFYGTVWLITSLVENADGHNPLKPLCLFRRMRVPQPLVKQAHAVRTPW